MITEQDLVPYMALSVTVSIIAQRHFITDMAQTIEVLINKKSEPFRPTLHSGAQPQNHADDAAYINARTRDELNRTIHDLHHTEFIQALLSDVKVWLRLDGRGGGRVWVDGTMLEQVAPRSYTTTTPDGVLRIRK